MKCFGTKAVARRCSIKKVFLEISQNSQENTCARVSFLIKLKAFGTMFYKEQARNFLLMIIFEEPSSIFVSRCLTKKELAGMLIHISKIFNYKMSSNDMVYVTGNCRRRKKDGSFLPVVLNKK